MPLKSFRPITPTLRYNPAVVAQAETLEVPLLLAHPRRHAVMAAHTASCARSLSVGHLSAR